MNPALLYFIFGLGGGIFLGHWKPLAFLAPKPPTAQLTSLQEQLAAAKTDAQAREAALAAAQKADFDKLMGQLQKAQQMHEGAALAFAKVPVASRGPEFNLGYSLLVRGNVYTVAAIGKIAPDVLAEIDAIVNQALSTVQAERDAAQAALARKDEDMKLLTQDREAIKAQLPALAAKAQAAEEAKAKLETAVTAKTNEVKSWADKLDAKAREAGSLLGSLDSVWHWAIGIGCAWLFLAFGLPGIVKHMASSPLKNTLRAVSGYTTSPLLFHDAATKIEQLTKPNP